MGGQRGERNGPTQVVKPGYRRVQAGLLGDPVRVAETSAARGPNRKMLLPGDRGIYTRFTASYRRMTDFQ